MTFIRIAFAFFLGLASPAMALDLNAMTDAERQMFRDEVRAYLLDNPEVLMEAIAVLEQRQAGAQAANDQQLVADHADLLFNDGFSFAGGNPDGDIVMVEFLDYKCGFCKKAHPEVAELIRADGNIKYIVKEYPILGEQSLLASRFAVSVLLNADHGSYAQVRDALMEFRGEVSEASLTRLSNSLGLDTAKILEHMMSPAVTAVIGKNHALGQSMAINGTPSFVIGDQMLRGYVPLDGMRQVVAKLRAEAEN